MCIFKNASGSLLDKFVDRFFFMLLCTAGTSKEGTYINNLKNMHVFQFSIIIHLNKLMFEDSRKYTLLQLTYYNNTFGKCMEPWREDTRFAWSKRTIPLQIC